MPGGPGDHERALASCQELRIEQQKRKPAEMVAVQVGQDDAVDPIVIDAAGLERDQRRCAEIDRQHALGGLEQKAGVEPATRAEGIARTDDGETHGHAAALGRAETSACQRLTFLSSSGTASFAGFMKSTATRPVMSATV